MNENNEVRPEGEEVVAPEVAAEETVAEEVVAEEAAPASEGLEDATSEEDEETSEEVAA